MPAALHVVNLLTLAVVLAAAVWTFWDQVRRETTHKQHVELAYWAAQNRMVVENPKRMRLPAPLDGLSLAPLRMQWAISNRQTTLLRLQGPQGACWNLLVRRAEAARAGAGLRPVRAIPGLLDTLGFEPFPLFESDRFVVYGADSAAARQLAKSRLAALLPADVGLILLGPALILDFSSRPFDPLELSRMTAVADQIAARLPASGALPALLAGS